MAIYPERDKVFFNMAWLESHPNHLAALLPEDATYAEVVRVIDMDNQDLRLMSDVVSQQLICYSQA